MPPGAYAVMRSEGTAGEGGDVAGVDGNGGLAIEGVERCSISTEVSVMVIV